VPRTSSTAPSTGELTLPHPSAPAGSAVRRFRLRVIEGPALGTIWDSQGESCAVGSHASNDLVIDDPTVSRFHCALHVDADGVRVRDAGSRNGTVVDGVLVIDAFLRSGSRLRLGQTVLELELVDGVIRLPLSERTSLGPLRGVSAAMRATFAIIERAAASDVTVLLEGETGTGKSQAARALHDTSARRGGPLITVDCGALLGSLLESELFGHEKGAFTGASERRIGAFEEAAGGTVFLDEIGELPIDLQPKLLRVLEAREVRRVGSNTHRPVDVRVVGATNRDLRADVNAGRFRADLYFRLAVITIAMPPLRQRPEDLETLVDSLLGALHATPEEIALFGGPSQVARLQQAAWPGNVRELRNYLERCLVMRAALPLGDVSSDVDSRRDALAVDPSAPYAVERDRVVADFERRYFEALLRVHEGKVASAARAAGLDRRYLYRILKRIGIGPQ
jgi:two-component system, NtrC family, response regulator GlrR